MSNHTYDGPDCTVCGAFGPAEDDLPCKPCTYCNGQGEIPVRHYESGTMQIIPCWACKATGQDATKKNYANYAKQPVARTIHVAA